MENPKLNILVADDEDGLRISLSSILELEGYNVREAADGQEAINIIQDPSFDIDVAFLDIRMPSFTGVDALREISLHKPSTTAVMMTAYAMNDLIREALALGVFACVSKPFEIDVMLQTIVEICSKPLVLVLDKDLNAAKPVVKKIKQIAVATLQGSIESAKALLLRRIPDIVLIDKNFEEDLAPIIFLLKTELPKAKIAIMGEGGVGAQTESILKEASSELLFIDKLTQIETIFKGYTPSAATVAIVSDNILESNNLKLALAAKSYDVSYFQTVNDAFTGISAKKTSTVFIDSKLISGNLISFNAELKKQFPDSEAIYMFDYETSINAQLSQQNIRYIQRPFDPVDIIKLITEGSKNG
ncbi:MAG: response regulator [Elusimicrobia bacterium]|nr:response regulator [Elusimicrobiota bacterium]